MTEQLKEFKLTIWSAGSGFIRRNVWAKSYDSAHYEFVTMRMFPAGTIAGVVPVAPDEYFT